MMMALRPIKASDWPKITQLKQHSTFRNTINISIKYLKCIGKSKIVVIGNACPKLQICSQITVERMSQIFCLLALLIYIIL